jgi:hypothetical protein
LGSEEPKTRFIEETRRTMLNKLTFAVLITAILCTLGRIPACAQATTQSDLKPKQTRAVVAPETLKSAPANARLRADMDRLVADAKAGRIAPSTAQMQPPTRNNLSKGKKIAIGVGIAIAVVTIVLIVRKPRLTGPVL